MNSKYLYVEEALNSGAVIGAIIGGSTGAISWYRIRRSLISKKETLTTQLASTKNTNERAKLKQAIKVIDDSIKRQKITGPLKAVLGALVGGGIGHVAHNKLQRPQTQSTVIPDKSTNASPIPIKSMVYKSTSPIDKIKDDPLTKKYLQFNNGSTKLDPENLEKIADSQTDMSIVDRWYKKLIGTSDDLEAVVTKTNIPFDSRTMMISGQRPPEDNNRAIVTKIIHRGIRNKKTGEILVQPRVNFKNMNDGLL